MAGVFEALPGLDVPVGAISKGLASMWEDTAAHGRPAPAAEDAKATQVNFILHLGSLVAPEDAAAQFQIAVAFSRRYPSRVVVLCPEDGSGDEMRAKVYGECTVGKSRDDTRCCEFVMLSYAAAARRYLENQVSTCLSTDLPLYYWAHRFADNARLASYQYFLTRAKRVLFDTASAPPDVLAYPWPRPEAVRDLAYARLLPVRQSLGQFLSRYSLEALAGGLRAVSLAHGAECAAEARALGAWVRERIEKCGAQRAAFSTTAPDDFSGKALALAFAYDGRKSFSWSADLRQGRAQFEADFGTGRTSLPASAGLLPPENALSEAMFF